jgi:hypothetical protein
VREIASTRSAWSKKRWSGLSQAEAEGSGTAAAAKRSSCQSDEVAVQLEDGRASSPPRLVRDRDERGARHLVLALGPHCDALVLGTTAAWLRRRAVITAQNRKWWVVIAMSGVMILLTVDFAESPSRSPHRRRPRRRPPC